MSTEAAAKKNTQKLQRAIVDGLEDVKAQDIQVFDTEHLSPLFERVIVASGTSNRQTKALATSVRDAVREAGFDKPRIEGEANGEWIIVDCGAAVAHIMQPAIRQYYHLEEIWGDKPVRTRLGAAKPTGARAAKASEAPASTPARAPGSGAKRAAAGAPAGGKSAGGRSGTSAVPRSRTSDAAKPAAGRAAAPRKSAPRKAGAKAPVPTVVVNKAAAKKSAAKKTAGARTATKTTTKAATKKAAPRKTGSA